MGWEGSPASRSRAVNHRLAAWPQFTETLRQTCNFCLGVGEVLHGFRVLLSVLLAAAVAISGAATSRPVPATVFAALSHPAQAVKLLLVQSRHPAYPALPALHLSRGHLLGSLLFFPGLQVPASSPRKGRRASWPSLFRDVVILSL